MTRSAGRVIRTLSIGVTLLAFPATASSTSGNGILVVRPGNATPASALASAPGLTTLERYCQGELCVALPRTTGEQVAIDSLARRGLVRLAEEPDAHKVFFAKATYDSDRDEYDHDFPGRQEFTTGSAMGQWTLVFKSFFDPSWRPEIESVGFTLGEPVGLMAFQVYGPKDSVQRLMSRARYIARLAEVPNGIKRFRVNEVVPGDEAGAPLATTVVIFAGTEGEGYQLLKSKSHFAPPVAYSTGATIAYEVDLTREEALLVSQQPDVIAVTRENATAAPSDERSNAIIAGTAQSPGTSYPLSLGTNSSSPQYWNNYLNFLNILGVQPATQTIGFLDTGVNSDAYDTCPPALNASGTCSINGTQLTDTTTNFNNTATRANDRYSHGTFTTAIAGGVDLGAGARDSQGWSYPQGVAPGAKIAMSKIFNFCPDTGESFRQEFVNDMLTGTDHTRVRYSLVELGSGITTTLPDGVRGAGANIFNHSWNLQLPPVTDYGAIDILLDQTTRTLHAAQFDFSTDGVQNIRYGRSAPALHVVSAGNYFGGSGTVMSPGIAKNVITVGASETYNQFNYGAPRTACTSYGLALTDSDVPRQVPSFSAYGYPNNRLKPNVVAPGTRVSVPGSSVFDAANCNCTLLAKSGTPSYYVSTGTSYSAPTVSGMAALVRAWLGTTAINKPNASPALTRATVVAGAHNLVAYRQSAGTCCNETGQCWSCQDMRPAPDQYQGWGGAALDQFFRPATNYYFNDQDTTLTQGTQWTRTLTVTDTSKPIRLALTWTDRASGNTLKSLNNLTNDLDVQVQATGTDYVTHTWYGNLFYYNRDDLSRTETSLRDPSPITYDRKNNEELIVIPAAGQANGLPSGAATITVTVTGYAITADGLDPAGSTPRQDFALAVINAH